MNNVLFSSMTRIADLQQQPLRWDPLGREQWAAGDYVVGRVLPRNYSAVPLELADGRRCAPMAGDLVVGAFGRRAATLEATGTFEEIGADRRMVCLTGGGTMGALTSQAPFTPSLLPLEYLGHVGRDDGWARMADYVPEPPASTLEIPVVLLVGTSMSAGKTYSGRVAVRQLNALGHTVVAAKLTGAGRWRDTLSFHDAGAGATFDFVDAGMPTTVVPAEEYRPAMKGLLARMGATDATVAVVEAGASPLEPYNGGTLVEMLGDRVVYTILAASDPYAVVGILHAWGKTVDLVTGPSANTKAAVALVRELSGLPALDLLDVAVHGELRERLEAAAGRP